MDVRIGDVFIVKHCVLARIPWWPTTSADPKNILAYDDEPTWRLSLTGGFAQEMKTFLIVALEYVDVNERYCLARTDHGRFFLDQEYEFLFLACIRKSHAWL